MTTRAVLLNRTGAVHRIRVGPDGADQTGCGLPLSRLSTSVSPRQALVFALGECHDGDCWAQGVWRHFVEGTAA